MTKYLSAIIFGIAIVVAAYLLGNAYASKFQKTGKIEVTGLGKTDFESDLVVWSGNFSAFNTDIKQAYISIEKDKKVIRDYLLSKGVAAQNMVFTSVDMNQMSKSKYSPDGKYIGDEFTGYQLKQGVEIESKEVTKIESISREITELLNKGVKFYSDAPRYYYTKLADLKIEMISKATEDARLRAEKIAEFSGGQLGDLRSAKMGIFQITGQNSTEDYSWGGTFNTSAKKKTASITMKLEYITP